jgi:hypothetical protein
MENGIVAQVAYSSWEASVDQLAEIFHPVDYTAAHSYMILPQIELAIKQSNLDQAPVTPEN